jgi:hypothetical protein
MPMEHSFVVIEPTPTGSGSLPFGENSLLMRDTANRQAL